MTRFNSLFTETSANVIEFYGQQSLQSLSDYSKNNVQKMKFFFKDFLNKYEQIRRKLGIRLHLLIKFLTQNFIFCVVKSAKLVCQIYFNILINKRW